MVTIGVLVRVDDAHLADVTARLSALDGVRVFPLEEPRSLGAVVQAGDLDQAHDRLVNEVEATPGVLCAWPLHTELADAPTAASHS